MRNKSLIPSSRTRNGIRLSGYDVACAALSPWAAFWLRDPDFLTKYNVASTAAYCAVSFLISLIVFVWFRVGHDITRYFSTTEAIEVTKAAVVAVALTAFVMFTFTRLDAAPRSLLMLQLGTLVAPLCIGRLIMRRIARRRDIDNAAITDVVRKNLLIVGATRLASFYIMITNGSAGRPHRIAAILDANPRLLGRSIGGYMVIGSPAEVESILDEYAIHGLNIDTVVVAGGGGSCPPESLALLRKACLARDIAVQMLPESLGLVPATEVEAAAGDEDDIGSDVKVPEVQRHRYLAYKRWIDITAVCLAAPVLLLPLLITAVVVILDVGAPAIFWQERIGRDRKSIHLYKFRTLRPLFGPQGNVVPQHKRLSRIGRFLRATRLDELPQLYNILIGDMSIVGPRPLLQIDQPADAKLRLSISPGLTGWAQVHGGKILDPEEKSALDEWYVRHVSFWLDLQILVRTMVTLFVGDARNDGALKLALQNRRGLSPSPNREAKPAGYSDG